jgi:hypothetical protein
MNPYDASKGGSKAVRKPVIISRPAASGPYQTTKITVQ